jgi:hypothetical protein
MVSSELTSLSRSRPSDGIQRLLCWIIAAGATALNLALTGRPRLQVCHGYCVKNMGDVPACYAKCRQFDRECIASGCWGSRVVGKQCGFTRQ